MPETIARGILSSFFRLSAIFKRHHFGASFNNVFDGNEVEYHLSDFNFR